MFIIGEAIIDDELRSERFACDLTACRGACCTLPGGRGAPLEEGEPAEIKKAYPFVRQYLSRRHRNVIEEQGPVEGVPGSYATVCVDDRACAFVYDDGGIARCSFERAYQEGLIGWRKPLSCHLFPLRVTARSGARVRYEKIPQCADAIASGRNLNMPLYVFLKEALVRKFGERWYERLKAECGPRSDSSSRLELFTQT